MQPKNVKAPNDLSTLSAACITPPQKASPKSLSNRQSFTIRPLHAAFHPQLLQPRQSPMRSNQPPLWGHNRSLARRIFILWWQTPSRMLENNLQRGAHYKSGMEGGQVDTACPFSEPSHKKLCGSNAGTEKQASIHNQRQCTAQMHKLTHAPPSRVR